MLYQSLLVLIISKHAHKIKNRLFLRQKTNDVQIAVIASGSATLEDVSGLLLYLNIISK